MPNANQILALVKSHLEGDDKRFKEVAMQIAAVEARSGHTILSRSIADLIKSNTGVRLVRSLAPLNMDVSEYVLSVDNSYRLSDLICSEVIKSKISRIIKEYIHRDLLYQNNLSNRNKILLAGPSGTGKTMTASILANELHLPLYVVRMEKVITKYMGETSLKLSKIFDLISNVRGIYLFDEFDAIGMQRGMENEVGEMRRILNTFLQLMERDDSDSIIVAATNAKDVLDTALFRRFDDVIEYQLPDQQQIEILLKTQLEPFTTPDLHFDKIAKALEGRSHAEITSVCADAIKESILSEQQLTDSIVIQAIEQKHSQILSA